MNPSEALLIVDAQVNMFDEEFSIYKADSMIKVLSSLIEKARAKAVPVIYLRNNGGEGEPDEMGTPGWEIHLAIMPAAEEIVIDKQGPDAFENTKLKGHLEELGIKQLVIAGMQTEMCVEATTRRAVELGFDVNLVEDGHSTFDFDDIKAVDEIARVNNELSEIARVVNAEIIAF